MSSGDGAKAVAKRKLQQTKLTVKTAGASSSATAQTSGNVETDAASPIIAPKVRCTLHHILTCHGCVQDGVE